MRIGDPITEKGLIQTDRGGARPRPLQRHHRLLARAASPRPSAMGEKLNVDDRAGARAAQNTRPGAVEIWIRDTGRMVLGVPPDNLEELAELAQLWDVRACSAPSPATATWSYALAAPWWPNCP